MSEIESNNHYRELRIEKQTFELLKEYKSDSQTYSDFVYWMLVTIFGPRLEYVNNEPCIFDVDDLIRKEMRNERWNHD